MTAGFTEEHLQAMAKRLGWRQITFENGKFLCVDPWNRRYAIFNAQEMAAACECKELGVKELPIVNRVKAFFRTHTQAMARISAFVKSAG